MSSDEAKRVYSPNDDSFLMLDALQEESTSINPNSIIVEVGSGSGFLIGNLTSLVKDPISIAIDISIDACTLTQRFIKENNLVCDCINANGLGNLRAMFDIVIFNPPYVPTEPEEVQTRNKYLKEQIDLISHAQQTQLTEYDTVNMIDWSYSGGFEGMDVTWRVLEQLATRISPNGRLYLFAIQDNPIKKIIAYMQDKGFSYKVLRRLINMNFLTQFSKRMTNAPRFFYHFPDPRFRQVGANPAVTAKRIIRCVGDRLRKLDPQRWDTTPITFLTTWKDERGYLDVETCIHVHDALEKEFGIDIKDRAFIVTDIASAFYLVTIHHDSI